ncbi:MAG: phage tail sheath family protein, partial [Verrucomicrobia bacterium]|nr:phage tail sheath family protein [Verrucomicrobiota bacterium]
LKSQVPLGLLAWGSRTLQGNSAFSSEWKYIPVRRTALFIEESVDRGTKWSVFEPNNANLWSQIIQSVETFMYGLFRQGAFQGTSLKECYFVKCGLGETMTQNDIDDGRLILQLGFAPLKPAEFVVITVQQRVAQP